jgi:hypothetical protein
MALWSSIAGLAGMTRRCGGLWRFLIVRAKGRIVVELERERNRATAEVIQLLPDDCELLEYEPKGRLRVIRRSGPRPATASTVTGEVLPRPSGELDR